MYIYRDLGFEVDVEASERTEISHRDHRDHQWDFSEYPSFPLGFELRNCTAPGKFGRQTACTAQNHMIAVYACRHHNPPSAKTLFVMTPSSSLPIQAVKTPLKSSLSSTIVHQQLYHTIKRSTQLTLLNMPSHKRFRLKIPLLLLDIHFRLARRLLRCEDGLARHHS